MTKCIMVPNSLPPFNLRRFCPNPNLFVDGVDEKSVCDDVIARNMKVGVISPETPYYIIDEDCQPGCLPGCCPTELSDYDSFFDCWEMINLSVSDISDFHIVVNMTKAIIVHKDRIRKIRDVELRKESGSEFRQPPEIEALFTPERQAKLQMLRDIPQRNFDQYKTPEALTASWPIDLPPRILPQW